MTNRPEIRGAQDILRLVIDIIHRMTAEWDIDPDEIQPESLLERDFGFTSMHGMSLLASIDEALDVQLPYEGLVLKDDAYISDLSVADIAAFVHEQANAS